MSELKVIKNPNEVKGSVKGLISKSKIEEEFQVEKFSRIVYVKEDDECYSENNPEEIPDEITFENHDGFRISFMVKDSIVNYTIIDKPIEDSIEVNRFSIIGGDVNSTFEKIQQTFIPTFNVDFSSYKYEINPEEIFPNYDKDVMCLSPISSQVNNKSYKVSIYSTRITLTKSDGLINNPRDNFESIVNILKKDGMWPPKSNYKYTLLDESLEVSKEPNRTFRKEVCGEILDFKSFVTDNDKEVIVSEKDNYFIVYATSDDSPEDAKEKILSFYSMDEVSTDLEDYEFHKKREFGEYELPFQV